MIHLIAAILFLASAPVFAAPAPPEAVPGGFQGAATLRAFVDYEAFTPMAEVHATRATAGRSLEGVVAGSYYHLAPAFKVGLFAMREFGLRHDEDWHSVAGKWSWLETNHRGETLLAPDLTGRHVLGENWVGELKLRYIYNSFNDDRTFFIRPGLTYFYMSEGHLVANLFAQVELDLPLNYSSQTVSEIWVYLGSLYHINEAFDVGPSLTLGWQTWSRPEAFRQKGGAPYAITTQTTTVGLIAVAHL